MTYDFKDADELTVAKNTKPALMVNHRICVVGLHFRNESHACRAGGCTSSSLASKPLMALKPKRRRFGVISFMGAKETQNWQGADETQEHQVLHPRG